MHDLIRLYAAEHLIPELRAAGFARVLVQYLRTADLAKRRFSALPADAAAVPAGFADRGGDGVGAAGTGRSGRVHHPRRRHPSRRNR